MPIAFFQSLRPKQWTKNLLLFAGIVFAQRWHETALVINAILGFAVFCALSGVVYIANDIWDLEQDRQHPKKKKRPLASGRISPQAAGLGAAILTIAALGASFALLPMRFGWLALSYLVLVFCYSWRFKHAAILDILILAMGFVIRALAGIEVIQVDPANPVPITSYFLLTTLFLALFLAVAKRRSELVTLGTEAGNHRKVLDEYSTEFLDMLLTVATAGTLFSYALWTTQGHFAQGNADDENGNTYLLVLTMPFVLYGVFRYLWLVMRRDEGGAPEALLIEDRPMFITVVGWMITVVAVMIRLK